MLRTGAVLILLLTGASTTVSAPEQLRERRRPLSVLIAFGTRRTALCRSVLWQTGLPVRPGLALATVSGAVPDLVRTRVAGNRWP